MTGCQLSGGRGGSDAITVGGEEGVSGCVLASSEPPPAQPGDLVPTPELVKRYMRVYNRLYMVWEAGSGKSCGYIASTEDFKETRNAGIGVMAEAISSYYREFPGRVRHVYVLEGEPGGRVSQAAAVTCTPGTYLTDAIRRAKTDKMRNRLIASAIKPWYTVTTYRSSPSRCGPGSSRPSSSRPNSAGASSCATRSMRCRRTSRWGRRRPSTRSRRRRRRWWRVRRSKGRCRKRRISSST